MIHAYRWVDDPEVTIKLSCGQCGSPMDALIVEPCRSDTYMNAIWLCQGPKRHILQRFDARRRPC